VSGDTGPMHLAAVLGVHQVAILGPGDVTRYDPRTVNRKARVFYVKTECSPCEYFVCPRGARCLTSVNIEDVASAVVESIEG
jgi:ADP-heptose:LPS heptosyltransferase